MFGGQLKLNRQGCFGFEIRLLPVPSRPCPLVEPHFHIDLIAKKAGGV